ncbi:MAG: radical SAM family heme chaperone HemW [Bacteroidota bacterium]
MAGIYIHIPFCKKKCNYCDFYSINKIELIHPFVEALLKEIRLRKEYLNKEIIETIYFGGGTPSILEEKYFVRILNQIYTDFKISENIEITIEINPDDVNTELLSFMKNSVINRVSLGVQSFFDHHLDFLGRRHNVSQCVSAIKNISDSSITNISIDLIYGLPFMTTEEWKHNLKLAFSFNIQHISAYHLSVEQNTPLYRSLKNHEFSEISEEESWKQFVLLNKFVKANNWECYEISNFAKSEYYSIHNLNYWKNKKYLGLGPSAHSYNLESRQWNISDIHEYLHSLNNDKLLFEKEILTKDQRYNDYIITSLRTKLGADLFYIKEIFGEKFYLHLEKQSAKYIKEAFIIQKNNILTLTSEGMFLSDKIFADLII